MIASRYRGRHHRRGVADRLLRAIASSLRAAPMRAEPMPAPPGTAGPVMIADSGPMPDPARRGDRGAFTVEFAASLPALLMLILVGLTAQSAASDRGRCYDAARDAALAAARGEPGEGTGPAAAPPGATVELYTEDDLVRAVVSVPVEGFGLDIPGIRATGEAVAAVEPGVMAGIR